MKQEVVFTNDIEAVIERVCKASAYDKYFVLCHSNTYDCVLPRLLSP